MKWYQSNIDRMVNKLLKSDLPESAEIIKREMSSKLKLLESCLKSVSNRQIQFRTGDPGTQLTSAINPIIADPEDWYGLQYYKPMPETTRDLVLEWATGKPSALKRLCRFLAKDKHIFWKNKTDKDEKTDKDDKPKKNDKPNKDDKTDKKEIKSSKSSKKNKKN